MMILFRALSELALSDVHAQARRGQITPTNFTVEERRSFVRSAQNVYRYYYYPALHYLSVYKTVNMFHFSAEMGFTRRYERVSHPYGLSIAEVVTPKLWEEWDSRPQNHARTTSHTVVDWGSSE